jgi:2-polyprenyl-6-methoxyphenol hydroxylase-like FAD-dependent oxidoreductase
MLQFPASVLVIGAGPTGLFLAYALARQGVGVRIIDQKAGPSNESRAMGVQARTLEFYQQFGLAEAAMALGVPTGDVHFGVDGRERFTFSLKAMGQGLSRFPFLLTLAQDVHERFLVEALRKIGVDVAWETSLLSLSQSPSNVTAMVAGADGEPRQMTSDWLVGCDGAASITRHQLQIGFSGGTTEGLFFVADVETSITDKDIHLGINLDTMAMVMPVRTTGAQRLIGIVPDAMKDRENISFADVGTPAARLIGMEIKRVNWFSTYRTHHRVADHFRVGRCFLAGDAGHIHSPVGGQGMNTGLGDAMNLAWKLAAVVKEQSPDTLLDSYETERIAFARQLVATTDKMFGKLVANTTMARFVRRHVAPKLVWAITRFRAPKKMIFSMVSQIRIHYRTSMLSDGAAGGIRGGDRLPYVADIDNLLPLQQLNWQLHIYGRPHDGLIDQARALNLAVHVFPSNTEAGEAGLQCDAAYLVRPDGYVGLALPNQDPQQLASYAQRQRLAFALPI